MLDIRPGEVYTSHRPEPLLPRARRIAAETGQPVTVYVHRTGSEYDSSERQIVFGLTQDRLGICVYSVGTISRGDLGAEPRMVPADIAESASGR